MATPRSDKLVRRDDGSGRWPDEQELIVATAAENLVGYSTAQPSLFKRNQLEPIKDLKVLIRDYSPIAKNCINMLVNLTEDNEIIENILGDEIAMESLLRRVTVCQSIRDRLVLRLEDGSV